MIYTYTLGKFGIFAKFFSFIVAYLFVKMDAGKVWPILWCRINRANMFLDIFIFCIFLFVVGAWCSFLKTFSAKIKCSALLKGSFYLDENQNGNAYCMFDKAFGDRIAKI